jgi:hypothetical protein
MRKIHVRASVAAFVLFFVFTLHALQLVGAELKPSQWTGKTPLLLPTSTEVLHLHQVFCDRQRAERHRF